MRASIEMAEAQFSAQRMVNEYFEKLYSNGGIYDQPKSWLKGNGLLGASPSSDGHANDEPVGAPAAVLPRWEPVETREGAESPSEPPAAGQALPHVEPQAETKAEPQAETEAEPLAEPPAAPTAGSPEEAGRQADRNS